MIEYSNDHDPHRSEATLVDSRATQLDNINQEKRMVERRERESMRSITDKFTSKTTSAFENKPYLHLWKAKEVWMHMNSLLIIGSIIGSFVTADTLAKHNLSIMFSIGGDDMR